MSELLNILREHKIIADGAFGTYFQSKYGDNDNVAPERANLTDRSKPYIRIILQQGRDS